MTRRITLAIIGTLVAALVLSGLGTLALAQASARQRTESDLRREARALREGIDALADDLRVTVGGTELTEERANARLISVVSTLRKVLRVDGIAIIFAGPNGALRQQPPSGVTEEDLELELLRADPGRVVSGHHGALTYAASATAIVGNGGTDRGLSIVVVTRRAGLELGPAVRWFLVASVSVVVLGALVAARLGRRISEPVRRAQQATHRIAAGDLAVRLPEPDPTDRDEVADLTRSVNVMAESLLRSQALEQQFLLSVSHDLRTPLTSIRGYAEAIADGAVSDPRPAANVILSESRRLERLVRDLLDLAKLDAHAFSLRLQPVDLSEVAAGVVSGFEPDAAAASVSLAANAPAPVMVSADPDRMAQVVANLVENALKYARSAVTVSAGPGPARVALLTVDDDGPGIAAEDLPHVFERLYVSRHHPARKESGAGLGLAIVRELVEAMGGSVRAEAAPGGGARMTVQLPLA